MFKKSAASVDAKERQQLIYQLDGRPPFGTAFPLGMQHVLCMFTSNLAPLLIVAGACGLSGQQIVNIVQCAMLMAGLTTLLQLYPLRFGKNFQIGAGIPIFMATSFAFVPAGTALAAATLAAGATPEEAMGTVIGCCIIGSIVELLMGLCYKFIGRLFPPLVVGAGLTAIGISLLTVGVNYMAGGNGSPDYGSAENMALGFGVFAIVVVLQRFGKGFIKNSAILIALVVGYVIAGFMGMLDFSSIKEASWVSVPMPWQFDVKFSLSASVSFIILFIYSGLQIIGNGNGVTIACFDRSATDKETSGGILADAVGSLFAAIFNCMPNTAFGQNAGIIAMTKICNKWSIALGAFVLVIASFLPKLGGLFSGIPSCVLGGVLMSVFGTILLNGIKMIAKAGFSERNILVLAITFSLGLGLAGKADAIANLPGFLKFIFNDSVAATCIVAIVINLIFPEEKKVKAAAAAEEKSEG